MAPVGAFVLFGLEASSLNRVAHISTLLHYATTYSCGHERPMHEYHKAQTLSQSCLVRSPLQPRLGKQLPSNLKLEFLCSGLPRPECRRDSHILQAVMVGRQRSQRESPSSISSMMSRPGFSLRL